MISTSTGINKEEEEPDPPACTRQLNEEMIKQSLTEANAFLANQITRNQKYIKSLKGILNWILTCSETISPELTSLMLVGEQTENYDFQLCNLTELNKYICKSKYFTLLITLDACKGRNIARSERIQLEVKLYSSETVPKQLVSTMHGKAIIRQNETYFLSYNANEQKFLSRIKMQITEVSSHFANGVITLVVEAKSSKYSIQPLVIKGIEVKAKETTCERWRQANK